MKVLRAGWGQFASLLCQLEVNVVEANETHIGGKPVQGQQGGRPGPRPRGQDADNRRGRARREGCGPHATDLSGRGILRFLQERIEPNGTLLITDEYLAYAAAAPVPASPMPSSIIPSPMRTAIRTPTRLKASGLWFKRAWYGSHHHCSHHWTPLFVAEASWKYNNRKNENLFGSFLRRVFQ